MSKQTKIAVIIPYFGPWPKWIDYFFLSCIHNPEIKWIFPSDNHPPKTKSPNLSFVPFSLQDFNEKASEVLNLDINIKHPYKICDFRPAYAEIFSELLADYDFWGYGDLDLVYGNIGNMLSGQVLGKYDILSNHPDFVTGHFCLLRNTPEINHLYQTGDAYRKALTDSGYVGFDEQIKKFKINPDPRLLEIELKLDRTFHILNHSVRKTLKKLIPYISKRPSVARNVQDLKDFTAIVRYAEQTQGLRVNSVMTFESDLMLEKQGKKNWIVNWTNGSLKNKDDQELLYFHFILSKNRKSFTIDAFPGDLSAFTVSASGITIKT